MKTQLIELNVSYAVDGGSGLCSLPQTAAHTQFDDCWQLHYTPWLAGSVRGVSHAPEGLVCRAAAQATTRYNQSHNSILTRARRHLSTA